MTSSTKATLTPSFAAAAKLTPAQIELFWEKVVPHFSLDDSFDYESNPRFIKEYLAAYNTSLPPTENRECSVETEGGSTVAAPSPRLLDIQKTLALGVIDDIWLDAGSLGYHNTESFIEQVKADMNLAGEILIKQDQILGRFSKLLEMASVPGGIGEHEFLRAGGWRETALLALQQAKTELDELMAEAASDSSEANDNLAPRA